MLAVSIDDAGFCSGISIDKEAVLVSFITRTFHITVTKRRFDGFKSRYGAAVALQFALAFIVSGLDGGTDFFYRLRIRLWNDEGYTVLRRTAVDRLRFPYVGVRPASVDSGNNFAGIYIIFRHNTFPP